MSSPCDLSDLRPPEAPRDQMEFFTRLGISSALRLSAKTLADHISEDYDQATEAASAASPYLTTLSENSFSSFTSSSTSQRVLNRRIPQGTSGRLPGRLSHSSGPLNDDFLTNNHSISPSDLNNLKYVEAVPGKTKAQELRPAGGGKAIGEWRNDRRAKKKEEEEEDAHNAELDAAISLAGVSSAVAASAVATAAEKAREFGRDERSEQPDMAVASAAILVAAQCVEAAKAMGADQDNLAAVIRSAVSARNSGDIVTLTAAAATATLKARALREARNIATVIPVEKEGFSSQFDQCLRHQRQLNSSATSVKYDNGDARMNYEENFLGICCQDVLRRGSELLKRTRKGDLHWKIVSVYISKMGQVILKMKSKHIAGAITKTKKSVLVEVCRVVPEWPGRNPVEGGEKRRFFGLKVIEGRVIEFECRTEREHEIWTVGTTYLLHISRKRSCQTS